MVSGHIGLIKGLRSNRSELRVTFVTPIACLWVLYDDSLVHRLCLHGDSACWQHLWVFVDRK